MKLKIKKVERQGMYFRVNMSERPIPWSLLTLSDRFGKPVAHFACAIDKKNGILHLDPKGF